MKKTLLAMTLCFAAISASAASPFLEFQPLQAGNHDFTAFNIQGGIMADIHPNFDLGIGIGFTERYNFNTGPMFPVFARAQFAGSVEGLNPFVSFDLGYEVNTEKISCGAILVNPMVGLKFGRLYGGVGYVGHCWTPKWAGTTSAINFKIGYKF